MIPSKLTAALGGLALLGCSTQDAAMRAERSASGAETSSGAARADAAPPEPGAGGHDGEDAGAPEPSRAAPDGGSLRARICGDRTTWPSPLARPEPTAARVGSMRFTFVEGPVWLDELGVLLFSDMTALDASRVVPSRIVRLTQPDRLDVLVADSGSNGLALESDGTVLAATHDNQSLSRVDPQSGERTALDVRYQGKRFNSPNDLAVRSDGTVFFTDPDWQIGPREPQIEQETADAAEDAAGRTARTLTGVYRVAGPLRAGETHEAVLLDGTLARPNGIALSPDERTLYVGSSGADVWRYAVAADGSVSERSLLATLSQPGSDGLTVDCAGNVYVTSGDSVWIYAPSGQPLGRIRVPEAPSNVAFGGRDHKTLYVTARTGLYSAALEVPGFPY